MTPGMTSELRLVIPAPIYLPSYRAALEAGWSPDHRLGNLATQRELDRLDRDAMAFLMSLDDPKAKGPPITLADGSQHARIPSYRRWLWDGEFCGSITFQWQNGTEDLPPHIASHLSFSVVQWKRGQGYGAQSLKMFLPDVRARGLDHVRLKVAPDNMAARRTIERVGGELLESQTDAANMVLVFRIAL